MVIDDRVVLKRMESNESDAFWETRGIDYDSVGTITSTAQDSDNYIYIGVYWDNGASSLCRSMYLELYKSENVSLPNRMFRRKSYE